MRFKLDLLHNLGSVDFRVLLSRLSILFWGVISTFRILPPKKESRIGQNNPENRRTLSYARGLLLFFLIPIFAHAQPGFFMPWGKNSDLKYLEEQIPVNQDPSPQGLSVRIAEHIIRFHQNVLSPVDGPRSHFRPSSSAYMMQSMQKHGFIEGFLMGCDRLMRENSDAWVYRTIEENGKWIKYDPVPDFKK